ncbi:hypothetical protein QBC43DRAFT_247311, partial [Cladorrhinum sp. PSN259]
MPPNDPLPQPESSKKRSRSGCITCRIRRVKCDESKPLCDRCASTGRRCDGYSSQLSSRALASAVKSLHIVGPASRVLGLGVGGGGGQPSVPASQAESLCFDFFRVCTAAMTSSVFPAPFWSSEVMKLAHCEPAVWKSVVAVGALHRRWECASSAADKRQELVERFTKEALKHYWGAIRLARDLKDAKVLVVVSVVLAAAANMAGQWGDSQVHVRSGMRLLAQMDLSNRNGEMESVAQTLGRLDFQAMVFNDRDAEYQYVEEDGSIPVWFHGTGKNMMPPGVGGELELTDLTQASTVLFGLIRYYFTVMAAAEKGCFPVDDLGDVHVRVVQETERWKVEFERLVVDVERAASRQKRTEEDVLATKRSILSLRLYHTTFNLLLTAGLGGPESRWDDHQPIFDRMLALAEELEQNTKSPLPFFMSLEPGLVMPLFLVATRCRHPIVRRRALNLLRELKRQEGVWNSSGAAVVAEQIVMAEEEEMPFYLPLILVNLDSIKPPSLEENGWPMIPEELRISRNAVLVDVESNRIELFLFRNHLDGSGDYLVK